MAPYCYNETLSATAVLVVLARLEWDRDERFWKPEGHSGHQDPENADFIQKLAKERESCVEVSGRYANHPQE